MQAINLYWCGYVRGPDFDYNTYSPGTAKIIRANVDRNIANCQRFRELVPKRWIIYCPHEHEDLYQYAYRHIKTEAGFEEICRLVLKQCCAVVGLADVLLFGDGPRLSAGMIQENCCVTRAITWPVYPIMPSGDLHDVIDEDIISNIHMLECELRERAEVGPLT